MAQQDKLQIMRHSLAHVMATALQQLWPEVKLGVGPAVENGFYYDIDLGKTKLTEEDLAKVEAQMREVIKADQKFEKLELTINEALAWAKETNQPYKHELLNDLKRAGTTVAKDLDADELGTITDGDSKVDKVSFYKNGPFSDLCRGPHVESTGKVGAFKLMRISGAYWRGKETNPQMQRIYGVAFETEKELRQHLAMLEEAKKRDHRKLGKEMDLFMTSDLVGAGLPLLMPKGETLKHTLMEYMRRKEEARGYQYVSTPVLAHEELYKRSGHTKFFADDMYQLVDDEGAKFYLKPMSCPHHHMIYERLVKSYKDLPFILAEAGGVYRYELSGTLSGLIRVRGQITQNDSHAYVTPEQLEGAFIQNIQLLDEVYLELGVKDYWFRLSLPDFTSNKYAGDKKEWQKAGDAIRRALKSSGADFVEVEGEAAFYGPKIDIQTRNVLGKEDSIATIQVDIVVPGRMGLVYVDSAGKEQNPVVIHQAVIGSYERFIGFLIEQTAGKFPVWLAPEQIRIATVNQQDDTVACAQGIVDQAKELGLRVYFDNSNESVGKKIREAEVQKVPYTVVVGEKEIQSGNVMPRIRKDLEVQTNSDPIGVKEFLGTVVNEAKSRVTHTSIHGVETPHKAE